MCDQGVQTATRNCYGGGITCYPRVKAILQVVWVLGCGILSLVYRNIRSSVRCVLKSIEIARFPKDKSVANLIYQCLQDTLLRCHKQTNAKEQLLTSK